MVSRAVPDGEFQCRRAGGGRRMDGHSRDQWGGRVLGRGVARRRGRQVRDPVLTGRIKKQVGISGTIYSGVLTLEGDGVGSESERCCRTCRGTGCNVNRDVCRRRRWSETRRPHTPDREQEE